MKSFIENNRRHFLSAFICLLCVLLAGCASDADIARATAEYTDQTAKAIAASGWKVSGAIFGGFIAHAIIS